MKRKKPDSLAVKWKEAFSGKEKKPAKVKTLQKPEVASLTLIKKIPAALEVSRQENPKDFELLSFVIKARTVNTELPYTSVVHVERTKTGSRIIATDGKTRLHVASINIRIPGGDYKPVISKDCIAFGYPVPGINFPDWSKAVPMNTEKSGIVNLEKTGKGNTVQKAAKMSLAVNTLSKKTGLVVNMRYIAELPKTAWMVYKEPGFGKVVVRQRGGEDNAFAVFIPVGKAA